MTPIEIREDVFSPDLIHRRWPFLEETSVARIDGRVDRLYLALIESGLSRTEAAHQIHLVVKASQNESRSIPWAQKTWKYANGEGQCTLNN